MWLCVDVLMQSLRETLICVIIFVTPSPLSPHGFFFKRPDLLRIGVWKSSHLSLNREGRWGTKNNFATSFLHFSMFSTAPWDLPNSRPVHSLMLSSYLILCLPCLLPPFTVPCKMVLARPDERETWPYHCSLRLFTMVRSSCGPIACRILARSSSLVTWPLYEMCILQ